MAKSPHSGECAYDAAGRLVRQNEGLATDSQTLKIQTLAIPTTRQLIRATVNRATLAADLQTVPAGSWAEITVKLDAPEPDLDRQVREAASGRFEVLKVLADLPTTAATPWQPTGPALHDLQPRDVFCELLHEKQLPSDELSAVFEELLALREQQITT